MIRVDRGARYVAVDSMGALRLSTTLVSPPTRHSKRITLCTHCTIIPSYPSSCSLCSTFTPCSTDEVIGLERIPRQVLGQSVFEF